VVETGDGGVGQRDERISHITPIEAGIVSERVFAVQKEWESTQSDIEQREAGYQDGV
jgi:hypothetical protein